MAKKNGETLQNPFIYQGFVSPEYFCDRVEETKTLIDFLHCGDRRIDSKPAKRT